MSLNIQDPSRLQCDSCGKLANKTPWQGLARPSLHFLRTEAKAEKWKVGMTLAILKANKSSPPHNFFDADWHRKGGKNGRLDFCGECWASGS